MTTTSTSNPTTSNPERANVIDGARQDVICVPEATEGAGALVWWSLEGTAPHAALAAAWEASGLPADDCPSAPTPALALRLAVAAVARARIRRRFEGGWVIGEEGQDDGGAWAAHAVCRVWIDEAGTSPGATPECQWEGDDAIGRLVRAHYEAALVDWPSTSVSVWLPAYVRSRCDGVTMRESGGVYYVPPAAVPMLQAIRGVLHSVSHHRMTMVQALRTADAVEAILGALAADTDAAIQEALDSADTARKAEHRVEVVKALRERLLRYEALLGERHADLGDRIDEAERALALIALGDAAPAAE
jgi:hypothetical protein